MAEPSWMKGPPRRILLATDLSARCDRALDRAAALANGWQAELIALHALEEADELYTSSQGHRLASWRRPPDAARIAEEQLRNDMTAVPASVSVIVKEGKPVDVILRAAKTRGCDLIVTPGLSVDSHGTRLGQGGGCYDRALRHRDAGTVVVTLLHEGEQSDADLPREPHDAVVDGYVTTNGRVVRTASPQPFGT